MKGDKWFLFFAILSVLIFLTNKEIYSGISKGLMQIGGVFSQAARVTAQKVHDTVLLLKTKKALVERAGRISSALYMEKARNTLLKAKLRKYRSMKKLLQEISLNSDQNITLAEVIGFDSLPIPSRIIAKIPQSSSVSENMPVIEPISEALIGKVEKRAGRFIRIELINSPGFKMGVETDSGSRGIWIGTGLDAKVIFVPIEKPMIQGETLYTSSLSTLFPEGLKVGTVTSQGKLKAFTLCYKAKPLFIPQTIRYLAVVKYLPQKRSNPADAAD